MTPPIVRIPVGEVFPGETTRRFGASARQVHPGDIAEIRWGVEGTSYDKGKVSKGLVISKDERLVDHGSFRAAREIDIEFFPGWFEQTVEKQVVNDGVAFVPTLSRMDFVHKFTLSTADMGAESWRITLVGHDCGVHKDGECKSEYLKKLRELSL